MSKGDVKMKRAVALLMVQLSFLICLFCISASAVTEKTINPSETISVNMEAGKASLLSFVPSVSGKYAFTSLSDCDTLAKLYDSNMNELLFDDDGGDTSNFYIEYTFDAGKNYIFSVWYYGEKIDYEMKVSLKLISAEEGHTHCYTEKVLNPPSCKAEGESIYTCVCGNSYTVNLNKTNHSFTILNMNSPDCVNKGYLTEKCSACGFEKTTVLDALGHSFSSVLTTDISPTCTAKGYASRHCIRCDVTTDVTALDKVEHTPEADFITIKDATCTAKGEKVKHCSVCRKVLETVKTDKVSHISQADYETVKAASCTATGQKVKHCVVCNKTLESVSIDKTEHVLQAEYENVKLPTCTAKGEKIKRCILCNSVIIREGIEKLGHNYGAEYTIDKKSSLSESGKKSRHCERCDSKTDITVIPKITGVRLSETEYAYNGKKKAPKVTVKNSKGELLKNNRDYTVAVKSGKNIGAYSVHVNFKGLYSGEATCRYSILPADVSKVNAKQTQSSVKLNWKKTNGNVKYRVYRKNMKNGCYKLITETKKNNVTINNLKSGKEYTFSVKAVKKVNGKLFKNKGVCRITVSTIPKQVSLKAVSEKAGHLKLSWKNTSCDGYEIFKYNEETNTFSGFKTIKKQDVVTYERNNMKRGKTYIFKIRSFKMNGKDILYSPFSNTVGIKVQSS